MPFLRLKHAKLTYLIVLAWDKPHQNQQTAVNRNKKIVHHDTMKKNSSISMEPLRNNHLYYAKPKIINA